MYTTAGTVDVPPGASSHGIFSSRSIVLLGAPSHLLLATGLIHTKRKTLWNEGVNQT